MEGFSYQELDISLTTQSHFRNDAHRMFNRIINKMSDLSNYNKFRSDHDIPG
jgi:hypothetical protein